MAEPGKPVQASRTSNKRARSNAFAEQLETFTKHNLRRQDEASEALNRLAGKAVKDDLFEVHRSAGEVALLTANRDAAKAEAYLEHGIVARSMPA